MLPQIRPSFFSYWELFVLSSRFTPVLSGANNASRVPEERMDNLLLEKIG